MNRNDISEKEFAVIGEISNNHLPDQRLIATRLGISLGLTNLIIKRLIIKGLVKAKQLNKRKLQYILTSKGFKEKAKKSYNFTLKTIKLLHNVNQKIQGIINDASKKGIVDFVIVGKSELVDITENALKTINLKSLKYIKITNEELTEELAKQDGNRLFLITDNEKYNINNSIQLVEYLSNSGIFI